MLSIYQQYAHFVDVYLDTTIQVTIDGTNYTLCAGWLGCVPHQEGMIFEQLEKLLPQHFPVSDYIIYDWKRLEYVASSLYQWEDY